VCLPTPMIATPAKLEEPKLDIRKAMPSSQIDCLRHGYERSRNVFYFLRDASCGSSPYSRLASEGGILSMDGPKKCAKMRFEATILLIIKEVDLERTQFRSQFQPLSDVNQPRFGGSLASFGELASHISGAVLN